MKVSDSCGIAWDVNWFVRDRQGSRCWGTLISLNELKSTQKLPPEILCIYSSFDLLKLQFALRFDTKFFFHILSLKDMNIVETIQ